MADTVIQHLNDVLLGAQQEIYNAMSGDPASIFNVLGAGVAVVISLALLLRTLRRPAEVDQEAAVELKWYTEEEVAKHNKRDDIWIIVKKPGETRRGVYNITEYVDEHVGGMAILRNPGKDNTAGVWGPQHPPSVADTIEAFHIGWVKEEDNSANTVQQNPAAQS